MTCYCQLCIYTLTQLSKPSFVLSSSRSFVILFTNSTNIGWEVSSRFSGGPRLQADHPSPLYYSALLGFPQLVETLLAQGANVNEAGGKYQYPLVAAIQDFTQAEARICMDRRAHVFPQYKFEYEELTQVRLLAKHTIVALLLEKGADPNSRDGQGYSALHLAVRQGYADISLALIGYGAGVDARDSKGRTALFTAIKADRIDMLQMLVAMGANVVTFDTDHLTPLVYATRLHNLQSMQLLLSTKVDIGVKNTHEKTALHFAVESLHIEGLKFLIASGADIEARDQSGRTPLHYAALPNESERDTKRAERKDTEIMKLLMDSGATCDMMDDYGMTPLDYSRRRAQALLGARSDAMDESWDDKEDHSTLPEPVRERKSQRFTTEPNEALVVKQEFPCEDDGGGSREPYPKRSKPNSSKHRDLHALESNISIESILDFK